MATTIVVAQSYGPESMSITCPHCSAVVTTTTEKSPSNCAWISCVAMGVFGLWLCCCIPFCMDNCKQVKHTCPNCKRYLGLYSPR